MDKLRLYTPHYAAIPRHVLSSYFILYKSPTPINGTKGEMLIYYYYDHEMGVHLTSTPNGITVETNPTRYLHGNNLTMIGHQELKEFVDKFSNRYETDFGNWHVSLFDYNNDIEVSNSPSQYFELFDGLKKWTVNRYETGVNFSTPSNTKAVTCYDLHRRCEAGKTDLPTSQNIIRIEASFNKMLPATKKLKYMRTLNDYIQPENYKQLPKLWLNAYQSIEKNETVTDVPNLSRKEIEIIDGINKWTLPGYRKKLVIDYPNHHRYHLQQLNALLKKMREYRLANAIHDHIDELNTKVEERANQLIISV